MKLFIFAALVYMPMACAGPLDLPYQRVNIYAMPWSSMLMNSESPDKIRQRLSQRLFHPWRRGHLLHILHVAG
jgi:hypothetical protein